MLLAIDAGNTNTVLALFDGERQVGAWRTVTDAQRTSDEYAVFLKTLMREGGLEPKAVTAAILGSVVPDANFNLVRLCRDHFGCSPMVVGTPEVQLGIKVLMDRPEEVGADRLINAVAGKALLQPPLLIVDFGTATTFDVVDAKGDYCGGAIAPGINLSLQALHMAAAKLPRVSVGRPAQLIGKNTVAAMKSGIYWGYVGLIEGLVVRFKKEIGGSVKVVATGGLAKLFSDAIDGLDQVESDLTLRGLQLIYERNKQKAAA